jgi:hypothetical protein
MALQRPNPASNNLVSHRNGVPYQFFITCSSPARNVVRTWWHVWCIYHHGVGDQRQFVWKADNRCGLQQTCTLIGELACADHVVCGEAARLNLAKIRSLTDE